jgi:HAD superfamily hydrolase (TIGR01459 family)
MNQGAKRGTAMAIPIPILTNARDLLARHPVVFCDVWGVLHDGVREYVSAGDALERYRANGGLVILLSNAPIPAVTVASVLDEKHVRRSAYDWIITSGDLTRDHLRTNGYTNVHHIGPDRSLSLFTGLGCTLGQLTDAEAIVCTGLFDDAVETGATYRPMLQIAHEKRLPFICANPDLVVDVGGRRLPCAGAIGAVYAGLGGTVYWAGKPYQPAYDRAFKQASDLLGRPVAHHEVLAIGDAIATDLAGAATAGISALFIAGGIHHEAALVAGHADSHLVSALFDRESATAVAAMTALTW